MIVPFWEEKVWGRAFHVFASSFAAVSCLEVKAGFRCSRHRHSERANLFAVLEGSVVVEEWPGHSSGRDLYLLRHGDVHTVPSGIWHRFRVLESGRVTEIYWPDKGGMVRLDDIEREDVGGSDDIEGLRRELFRIGRIQEIP